MISCNCSDGERVCGLTLYDDDGTPTLIARVE